MPRADSGGVAAWLATAAALVLLVPVTLTATAAGLLSRPATACTQAAPARLAMAAIPRRYLFLYRQAGHNFGIPWQILAGIGQVESNHGRSRAPGVHTGANSADAAGPMQFVTGGTAGNTWGGTPVHPATKHNSGYGIDGNHDGVVNVYDPGDAIPSAASYLKANGAPARIRAALYTYNHSARYVALVLAWAARYAGESSRELLAATALCGQPGPDQLPGGAAWKILAYAKAQIGKPYQWGATGPGAFDCSGLTMMAYRAAGITIPRTSQEQWAAGTRIPASHARPGDLVFFAGADGTPAAPGHVGILISPGRMIDAPFTGQDVRIDRFDPKEAVGYTEPRS